MKFLGFLLLVVLAIYGYHRYTEDQKRRDLIAAHTFVVGTTVEDVIAAKGNPTGRAADGRHETLAYADVIINFEDGRVTESHAPQVAATPPQAVYRGAPSGAAPGAWMWDKNHHSALDAPSPKPRKGAAPPSFGGPQ